MSHSHLVGICHTTHHQRAYSFCKLVSAVLFHSNSINSRCVESARKMWLTSNKPLLTLGSSTTGKYCSTLMVFTCSHQNIQNVRSDLARPFNTQLMAAGRWAAYVSSSIRHQTEVPVCAVTWTGKDLTRVFSQQLHQKHKGCVGSDLSNKIWLQEPQEFIILLRHWIHLQPRRWDAIISIFLQNVLTPGEAFQYVYTLGETTPVTIWIACYQRH